MKIGIFLSSLGLIRGGLETIAAHFAEGLAQRGHAVTCVAGAWPGRSLPPDLEDLPVTWLRAPCVPPTLPLGPFASSRRGRAWRLKLQSLSFMAACRWRRPVRRLWNTADVTLSLLEIETVYLSAWRARRRLPHLSYFSGAIDWKWLRRDRSTLRLAISRTLAERYRSRHGFRLDGVVTPGIEAAWLSTPYQIRPQARTLLFTGRLETNKGVRELLQCFRALVPRWPHLRLHLLGDGPLRPMLQAQVREAGLAQRVTFFGALPPARVRAELSRADLFLFPSHYESFGIAVVEAQAVGVPVLCSDLPVLQEATGGAAYLAPPRTVTPWVQAIEQLLGEDATRRQLSEAGRHNAQRYTWTRKVDELEHFLWQAQEVLP